MDPNGDNTHFTKRVTLPSGKTIEVVYFADDPRIADSGEPAGPGHPPAERHQDLHVCVECDSELVYPVQWEEAGPENWSVLLHCPNCDVFREGVPLRWSGIPQDAGHRGFGQFTAFHEASPSENRAFRVSTARKIRVLTAPTEIPRTLAISE